MILHRYFARRFAMNFAGVFAGFFAMLMLLDLIEQLRRFSADTSGFGELLALTLLNMPQSIYTMMPLIVILTTVAQFLSLARSSELVVTRAAGRSALRALVAPLGMTLLIGLVAISVLNPIVAATSKEFETRVGTLRGTSAVLSQSGSGFWLRQGNAEGQTVIRAQGANLDGTELLDVSFITFSPEGQPLQRIEAATALLDRGGWQLTQAKVWPLAETGNPEVASSEHEVYEVGSSLTPDEIRDSFGTPSSIPIWELPSFINRLQDAGFTARRHQVFFQMELSTPLFLIAMVMIGAGFTMQPQRGRRTGLMVLTAILLSFGLYFLRNFAQILGENDQIPTLLAAWAPPFAAICLALGLLLHLEDG